jgi:ribonucleoside-diphosphate reductase alpha chain
MGMMSVEHPDILKFLYAKQNLEAFTNFNISVKVTDNWMKEVFKSGKALHIVRNPRTQEKYLLPRRIDIAGYTIKDLHKLSGKEKPSSNLTSRFYTVGDVWKMIVTCAHKTGEPGLAFIDQINKDNPTPSLGLIEATNPCGEQPLLPHEACTLGSINLTKFVTFADGRARMDWSSLAETTRLAVRFLDNIIDVCDYPVKETARLAQANRKIGLGVMGFADCLFLLGIPYDSQQGVKFGSQVMKFINDTTHEASAELADLRGPFPNYSSSIWRTKKNKIRNAAITCVAPTGTISIIADCSAGIEPAYSLVFVRQVLQGAKMVQINSVFKKIAQGGSFYGKKLQRQIAKTGSIQKMTQIPAKVRRVFRCAYDITPKWHIRMQAAFQKHCDAAVSKTINFPQKAAVSAVDKAYKLAYRLGCKGITIYRRHSRAHEPMTLD